MMKVLIPKNEQVCPISITDWYEEGVNPCMYELLWATVLGTLVLSGLLVSLISSNSPVKLPSSWGCRLKLLCHVLVFGLLLARMITSIVMQGPIYAYLIVYVSIDVVSWITTTSLYLTSKSKFPLVPSLFWFGNLARYAGSFSAWNSPLWFFQRQDTTREVQFYLYVAQVACVLYICVHSVGAAWCTCCCRPADADRVLLINSGSSPEVAASTIFSSDTQEQTNPRLPGGPRPDITSSSTWSHFFVKVVKLIPFVWPRGSCLLQIFVLICVVLLVAGRVINLFLPILYRDAVNELSSGTLALKTICLYCLVYAAQGTGMGNSGLIGSTRSQLWLSVTQYTNKEVNCQLFRHIQELSIAWHLGRKTGEVIRIVDRSSSAITNLLNYILFSIGPCIVDLMIAIVYFVIAFNIWYGLIIFVTMTIYMVATIVLTEWRTQFRRTMNQCDNDVKAAAVDTLLNFETVKYFGAEDFESKKYAKSLGEYLSAQYKAVSTLNMLNLIQNMIISVGTLGGCILIVYDVHAGRLSVGDFVLFVSYIRQLYLPLNWFGTYYRMIQNNFIDMENMFELLEQPKDVEDKPEAPEINVTAGRICFDDVTFKYREDKEVLNNVSFTVESGKSVALVGPSGHGKSTIMKLLFRFYDINSGLITIDNQDISEVTQQSLRKAIGVVPQDTVLFNDTIRYNIRYGRVDCNDPEVEEASRNADIHNSIINFPDGYDTKVGERGLKLSGGEKQRVAIARTLLKSPQLVLLDEATSALDTSTERNIQASLNKVCEGKTSLIIAHRLSTIVHCHQILVLKEGRIVERGTHEELLEENGVYSEMWSQQISGNEDLADERQIQKP
ncbi:hypothetical protein ACHWQZ_G007019 [Mnemiopsis leidyi]